MPSLKCVFVADRNMSRLWKPWVTPAQEIIDTIYEIPKPVVRDYWRKQRPDLARGGTDDGIAGDLNIRGWRISTTSFVQAIQMRTTENSSGFVSEASLKGICSAMQEARDYNISASCALDENRRAVEIVSCTCDCIAASNLRASAHCKHVLALVYAVSTVVDAGVVPEWPACSTSFEQTWGVGHAPSSTRDLRPDRADIYAYFLRPDRRRAWKADNRSRVGPNMASYSTEEMTMIRKHVQDNSVHYPEHLLRLLEEPDADTRFPRTKSQELVNPFADRCTWPDGVPRLPIESADVTHFADELLFRLTPELQVELTKPNRTVNRRPDGFDLTWLKGWKDQTVQSWERPIRNTGVDKTNRLSQFDVRLAHGLRLKMRAV